MFSRSVIGILLPAVAVIGLTMLTIAAMRNTDEVIDTTAMSKPTSHTPTANNPAAQSPEQLVELEIELPNPVFTDGGKLPPDVRLDRDRIGRPYEPLMTPRDVKVISRGQPVSSSDPSPIIGKLSQITDGDKEALDGRLVELNPGRQWVQIDLGTPQQIFAVAVWHDQGEHSMDVYRDVIVQISDDPAFEQGVTIVFNNDHDNTSGLGPGEDYEYLEHFEGLLVPVKAVMARYVRCWSNGSTRDPQNQYTEIEVFGRDPQAK